MRKFFSRLHLWLSLPVGVIISVICFSAAAYIFRGEISRGLNPNLYRVEVPEGMVPLTPSELVSRVRPQIPDSLVLYELTMYADPAEAWMLDFEGRSRRKLSVNPYTGEVNGWTKDYAAFSTILKLHRYLLDPPAQRGARSVGKEIVGYSTLVFLLILLSGLIIWAPRNIKMLRQRLRLHVRKGWFRFWYDTHVVLGFYATILLLIMALTGPVWSFPWYRDGLYKLFGVEMTNSKFGHNHHNKERMHKDDTERLPIDMVWDTALQQIRVQYPVYKSIVLKESTVEVFPNPKSSMRHYDVAQLDGEGNVTSVMYFKDRPKIDKARSLIFSLHTGSWAGVWSRILYFCAALIGGVLPLTGYYMYIRRLVLKRRKRRERARKMSQTQLQ